MAILKLDRNSIETGGFHGIEQKRLIVHPQYGPSMGVRKGTWSGVGNLIYLADSWFKTGVATGLHPHQGIDVLTFVVEGKLTHEGSLEHGVSLNALDFQVQKSGKKGFRHNEVNKGVQTTRMLQLWLLPEKHEPEASFRVHKVVEGKITKIYGTQDGNTTQIEVGYLMPQQEYITSKDAIIYVVSGSIITEKETIEEGTLLASSNNIIRTNAKAIFISTYSLNEG